MEAGNHRKGIWLAVPERERGLGGMEGWGSSVGSDASKEKENCEVIVLARSCDQLGGLNQKRGEG